MISIIISLILIVISIAIPITAMLVNKWHEIFIVLSVLVVVLAITNLIMIIFNVYLRIIQMVGLL